MYKCSECEKEYIEKPDFCDCGNDEFVYFEQIKKTSQKMPLSLEQKSQIMSWIFFVLCMIFSAVVWLIPIKEEVREIVVKEENTQVRTIPDLDKIWDSTPVKLPEQAKKEVQVINTPQPKPVSEPVKVVKPKQSQPVQQKNVSKPKNTNQKSDVKKSAAVKDKNVDKQTAKPKENKVTEQKVQSKPEQKEKKEEVKKTYNPNSPEMLKYKGDLRAVLFRKFPVGSIQGSGTCSVRFSVDSKGKLINRSFVNQSSNKSLNDAVYYMLMSVPTFKAPPSTYSGEPITMTFSINNGNYEITIK